MRNHELNSRSLRKKLALTPYLRGYSFLVPPPGSFKVTEITAYCLTLWPDLEWSNQRASSYITKACPSFPAGNANWYRDSSVSFEEECNKGQFFNVWFGQLIIIDFSMLFSCYISMRFRSQIPVQANYVFQDQLCSNNAFRSQIP